MSKRKKPANMSGRVIQPLGQDVILYRWNIGPALRKAGFKAVDLWADGPLYTLEECKALGFDEQMPLRHKGFHPCDYAEAAKTIRLLTKTAREQIKAGRTAEPKPKRPRGPRLKPMQALISDYLQSMKARVAAGELSPKTAATYSTYAREVGKMFGDEPPAALTKELVKDWIITIRRTRGNHVAHKSGAQITRMLRWAEGKDRWAPFLPADARAYTNLELKKPSARLRVGTSEEMETLARTFDFPEAIYAELETPLADRVLPPAPSMTDALIAMLWTAARVNDALSFTASNIYEGRLIYRQAKTGTRLSIPIVHTFADRLPAIHKRSTAVRSATSSEDLIINERDGRPYWRVRPLSGDRDHRPFNDRWIEYRALAAQVLPSIGGIGSDPSGAPWLAFNAQDCRDTAVSRLALATDSLAEIAAWHGSSVEEIAKLAKHYLAITPTHADRAGDKLAEMCAKAHISI